MHTLSTAEEQRGSDLAVDRARDLLTAELDMLALPTPTLRLVELEEELEGLAAPAVDRVLVARYLLATRVVHVTLPLSGDQVLPAEFRTRIEAPAPATALLTRAGWQPHREQDDDELAALFLATLEDCADLGRGLRWAMDLRQGSFSLDWSMQVIAHAADSCQLIVRTAPTGRDRNRVGMGAFLDQLRIVNDLVQSWYAPFALPLGVARDCLALATLPEGHSVDVPRSLLPPELRDEVVVTIEDDDEEMLDEALSEDITELATDAWTVIPLYEQELCDEPTVPDGGDCDDSALVEDGQSVSDAPALDALVIDEPELVAESPVDFEIEVEVTGSVEEPAVDETPIDPPQGLAGELPAVEYEVELTGSLGELDDDEEWEEDEDSAMAEAVLVDEDEPAAEDTAAEDTAAEDTAAEDTAAEDTATETASVPAPVSEGGPRPGLAAAASLLLPGVGQIMAGQAQKGVLLLVVSVLTLGLGGLLNLFAAVDAYKVARAVADGRSLRRFTWLP